MRVALGECLELRAGVRIVKDLQEAVVGDEQPRAGVDRVVREEHRSYTVQRRRLQLRAQVLAHLRACHAIALEDRQQPRREQQLAGRAQLSITKPPAAAAASAVLALEVDG